MAITCPKCAYTRKPQDQAPEYECPNCGVIYAKAKPRSTSNPGPDTRAPTSRLEEPRPQDSAFDAPVARSRRWIDSRENRILLGAVLASFIVGYFAGREHIKYEMRSAFADAAEGIKRAFGGNSQPPKDPPKKQARAPQAAPISPKLLRKGFQEGEYGRNAVTFSVEFANLTGKDVRAFDGTIVFTDLLGNEIHGAKLAVNDRIAAGGTMTWEGKLDYNQFISSHERLRNAEIENMKVVYTVKRVMFEDGEVKEFAQ